ncbi:HD domain-containing protein, partial [Enterococcus faecium]|nr:HD domain-containing protein [Enterococcus faecium]
MKMDYSNKYTAYSRENLMQKIQMRMSAQRFKHVLGVEETAVALAKNYVASPEKAS